MLRGSVFSFLFFFLLFFLFCFVLVVGRKCNIIPEFNFSTKHRQNPWKCFLCNPTKISRMHRSVTHQWEGRPIIQCDKRPVQWEWKWQLISVSALLCLIYLSELVRMHMHAHTHTHAHMRAHTHEFVLLCLWGPSIDIITCQLYNAM